jgi:hypothetical protein
MCVCVYIKQTILTTLHYTTLLDRTAEQLAQLTFANGKPGPNPHIMKVDPSSL